MSDSSNFQSSSSGSSGGSFIPDYQQSPLLMQIAQTAQGLGNQQYQWGKQQFANNSQVTDQAVQNYLNASRSADALAQNNINRYENVFQPQEDALIRDANTYNSEGRIRSEMGRAESDAGQAGDTARQNAERQLQSYGIDPSSGRYAELESAQNAQRAASQVSAGTQARLNTENTGRQLRSQAIQVGQQYPGQAVNALNSEVQSLSGAVNSKLANTNTGVNALESANPFLQTGMSLKYPPLGTNQSSSSQSSGSGMSSSGSPSGSSGGSSDRPYSAGDQSFDNSPSIPTDDNAYSSKDYGNYSGGYGGAGSGIKQYDTGVDPQLTSGGGPSGGTGDTTDYGWGTSDPYGGGGGGGGDTSGTSDTWGGGSSSGFDESGFEGAFAAGGAIPDPLDNPAMSMAMQSSGQQGSDATSGGYVPPQASPSMGHNVDDIPANLNAEEFVVPRDVARWKGEEFFQKLIEDARKKRMSAASQVGGKPSAPAPGPARFASQAMGAR